MVANVYYFGLLRPCLESIPSLGSKKYRRLAGLEIHCLGKESDTEALIRGVVDTSCDHCPLIHKNLKYAPVEECMHAERLFNIITMLIAEGEKCMRCGLIAVVDLSIVYWRPTDRECFTAWIPSKDRAVFKVYHGHVSIYHLGGCVLYTKPLTGTVSNLDTNPLAQFADREFSLKFPTTSYQRNLSF